MKLYLSSLLLTFAAVVEGSGIRSRQTTRGPDRNGASIRDCFLVNLATKVELKLDGSNDYDPSDSSKGWSVKCFAADGKVDYVKFFYDSMISTQYYSSDRFTTPQQQPFWMEGDQNGNEVNDVPYLATPGIKVFTVKFYTWPGGDEFPSDEKTYILNAGGGGCNNGGYQCPPGFTAMSSCPLGFQDCFCNNGGFQCPPSFYPNNACPLGLNDCVCFNGGFSCPAGFKPTNSCPQSTTDCVCDNGGFTCPVGFKPTNSCPLAISDCVCDNNGFMCPSSSTPKNSCPQSFDDCDCTEGLVKQNGACVMLDPIPMPGPGCGIFGFLDLRYGVHISKSYTVVMLREDTNYSETYTVTPGSSQRLEHMKEPGYDSAWENFGKWNISFKMWFVDEDGREGPKGVCRGDTPIALDVDRSGAVERIEGEFMIDIDGDGKTELMYEWFAPTEGILISLIPLIKDGHVTGKNLFGDMGSKYEDGYDKLALLDVNQDKVVSGDELVGLAIWVDANSNAVLDDGELFTLDDYKITGLRTDKNDKFASSAMLSDGSEMYMEDLWFSSGGVVSEEVIAANQ